MHEVTSEHWHEPEGMKNAGYGAWKRPNTPYDDYMEAQGIPIFRGIGVRRVQDMPLKRWNRMGGNGTFLQLYGTEGKWGCYVIEVPGAGALNPERHMYEGDHGRRGRPRHHRDLDRRPEEAAHLRVAAGLDVLGPAQLLAPHRQRGVEPGADPGGLDGAERDEPLPRHRLDLQLSRSPFPSRFDGSADFFKPKDDIKPDPLRGLAMSKSNLIPDIMNGKLYLDNRRSPGYLRVEPSMANNVFYGFIGEHETGRYSKAHAHMSSAILVCLKGKGYTYTWPRTDGNTPWKDGKTQNIYRQDYEPVGIVTAAPYGGDWFHAHFGISKEPLRLIGWYGPNNHRKDKAGIPAKRTPTRARST